MNASNIRLVRNELGIATYEVLNPAYTARLNEKGGRPSFLATLRKHVKADRTVVPCKKGRSGNYYFQVITTGAES